MYILKVRFGINGNGVCKIYLILAQCSSVRNRLGQVKADEYSVMVIGAEYFSLCCHAGQRKPLLPAEHPSLHRNLLAYLMKMKVCLLQALLLPPQHQLLQHPTSNLGKEGFRESMHLCVPCYTCSSCVQFCFVCCVCTCVYVRVCCV